jgi:allophanate hydrolase subunit 1
MEQKQLTQEELANVKELASSLNDITTKFGQLKVEKLNLLTQISALEELENSMDKEYFELKEKEYTLSKELSEKYGEGTLNLETGAIS